MKVALLSTYDIKGGAPVACYRLNKALKSQNIESKMLVQTKLSKDDSVVSTTHTLFQRLFNFYRFAFERFIFFFYEKSKKIRFAFSMANIGKDISNNQLIQEADVLHLHWINQGFLSIKNIKKLCELQKPIVWTMHDMWAFTGGCHYSEGCEAYKNQCKECLFLKYPGKKDLSYRIWQKKTKLYQNASITFVTCSKWLASIARESSLLKNFKIDSIPNPIDTNLYRSINKQKAREQLSLPRDRSYILFGAMNLSDERKGFKYLKDALKIVKNNFSNNRTEISLIIFGKYNDELLVELPFKVFKLGKLEKEEQIILAYNAADIFVLPSLQDNLPNTVMEAMACGTPVVAFNTGGIPELIDHERNGYLAKYKSAKDIAIGIEWILENKERYSRLSTNACQKVLENYTYEKVAEQYINLYKQMLTKQKN